MWRNADMDTAETRRAVLRSLIAKRFGGVARRLAAAVKKPDGQINDMLADQPRKAFGEKVARGMEQSLGLPAGYFDDVANVSGVESRAFGIADGASPGYRLGPIAEVVEIMRGLPELDQMQILGAARMIQHERRRLLLDMGGATG